MRENPVEPYGTVAVFENLYGNLFEFGLFFGISMLVFSLLISWSRWMMKRHSLLELIAGGIMGILFGLINLWIVG